MKFPFYHVLGVILFLPVHPVSAQTDIGPNASLHGKALLPADDPWNQDISKAPVDPESEKILNFIGRNKPLHPDFGTTWQGNPNGIPYVVVTGTQPKVAVTFTDYGEESDPGPYPIPPDAPVEGGSGSDGDRHVLVLDRDNWRLYEMWRAFPVNGGKTWKAANGAVFDLKKKTPQRPAGWTSADAAGLPVLPGLVRFDEVVEQKEINHALRFTVRKSRRACVSPATHFASSSGDSSLPPMGMRVRLKADFDISGFPASVRIILTALKKYGMIVADNGGDWFISGAPDPRWNDEELQKIGGVKGGCFEVIRMDGLVTR